MQRGKSKTVRISGRKHECQNCGHVHKQLGPGKGWFCMKKGCTCPGMMVAGRLI